MISVLVYEDGRKMGGLREFGGGKGGGREGQGVGVREKEDRSGEGISFRDRVVYGASTLSYILSSIHVYSSVGKFHNPRPE